MTGAGPAHALTHARILLKANRGEAGPGWTDRVIAEALEVHPSTVARVRQYRRNLDGEQEARLVALADSAPPEGGKRWTVRLLADRLVELEVVEDLSRATVRQVLQQTGSGPGGAAGRWWAAGRGGSLR
jgi:Homeodomain-like domain